MSWLFSQALVEAYSPTGFLDGEPPSQLNVMPTPQQFSRNDKMMEPSRFSRFGLTLRLLTDDHGEALLTAFREASRVRISASLGKGPESTANDQGFGEKWQELSMKFDRDTLEWKTHQLLFEEVLPESSVILPKWGMMRDGVLLEHTKSVLPTSEKGSGFMPTPTASRGAYQNVRGKRVPKLEGYVKIWPTPTAMEPEKNIENYLKVRALPRGIRGGGKGPNLATAVKIWPTPMSADGGKNSPATRHKGGGHTLTSAVRNPSPVASDTTPQARDWKDSGPTQGNRISPNLGTVVGGRLNPDWVEWLMGWPIGWTDLKPLAMDRFRQWLRAHGIS